MNIKEVAILFPNPSSIRNTFGDGVFRFIGINNASDADGDVLMTSYCYKEIFGTSKKTTSNSQKRLSIVRISANGKSIHRTLRCVSATDFTSDYAALSPNSIMLLNDENGNEPQKVEVSKGRMLPYYWNHPDKAIRISCKLGLLSLLLGIISIFVSIICIVL